MSDVVVVVAHRRLEQATLRHVSAACDRLGARYQPWTADGRLPESPTLVVGGLPVGERQIPRDLLALCTEAYPGTPLLLLCQEGLVSPTVSLHGGQVVLVGPPLTGNRIYGRLAVLCAERRGAELGPSTLTSLEDGAGPVWTRERLHADLWAAGLGCRGLTGGPQFRPLVSSTPEGVTGLVPTRPTAHQSDAERLAILDVLRSGLPAAERLARLTASFPDLGLVHFDRRSEEWLVAWPRLDFPLWIYSRQRLPPWWDLAASLAGSPLLTLKAYPGDLLVGLTAPPPDDGASDRDAESFADVMGRGGPAVLAALEQRLEESPQSFAGVVMEARS